MSTEPPLTLDKQYECCLWLLPQADWYDWWGEFESRTRSAFAGGKWARLLRRQLRPDKGKT